MVAASLGLRSLNDSKYRIRESSVYNRLVKGPKSEENLSNRHSLTRTEQLNGFLALITLDLVYFAYYLVLWGHGTGKTALIWLAISRNPAGIVYIDFSNGNGSQLEFAYALARVWTGVILKLQILVKRNVNEALL